MKQPPNSVLITPLDWGLGHATRCIPIINWFIQKGWRVVVAGDGPSKHLLEQTFPQLLFLPLPGYQAKYNGGSSQVWTMLRQLPRFFRIIKQEHVVCEQIIQDHHIDLVISDNRYGCWSATVRSYIVTHQTSLVIPRPWRWLAAPVNRRLLKYLSQFTGVLVPDDDTHSLSGALSTNSPSPTYFLGPLSRFTKSPTPSDVKYDLLVLLSGPEPQRTIFETIVMKQLQRFKGRVAVVRGNINAPSMQQQANITIHDLLFTEELQRCIESSALVLARSGYSTIMDLAALQKKAIFVATPGQTEQEYLALRLSEMHWAFTTSQRDFDLLKALEKASQYSGIPNPDIILAERLTALFDD